MFRFFVTISFLFVSALVFAQGGGHNQDPQPEEGILLPIVDILGGVAWDIVSAALQDELGICIAVLFGFMVAWYMVVYVINLLRVMGVVSESAYWRDMYVSLYEKGKGAQSFRERVAEAERRAAVKDELKRRQALREEKEKERANLDRWNDFELEYRSRTLQDRVDSLRREIFIDANGAVYDVVDDGEGFFRYDLIEGGFQALGEGEVREEGEGGYAFFHSAYASEKRYYQEYWESEGSISDSDVVDQSGWYGDDHRDDEELGLEEDDAEDSGY